MRIVVSTGERFDRRWKAVLGAIVLPVIFGTTPATAQIERVDPNDAAAQRSGAIDGDLDEQPGDRPVYVEERPFGSDTANRPASSPPVAPEPGYGGQMGVPANSAPLAPAWADPVVTATDAEQAAEQAAKNPQVAAAQGDTYKEDDLIGAAEGLFGDGAKEVAGLIQDLLKDQGEPNGYIVGREAGGAFILGARYGSGTLFHKVEGQRPVYWTGPSIGFDAGANAGNTFVLVYNLYDTEDLYRRFPAGEGQAYIVGGMTVSYMRWGDTVLIPIRVGAGLRLGINAGYMRFSKKQRWVPF